MTKPLLETHFDCESGIAELCFNRPKVLNAINVDMAQALRAAVEALSERDSVRCIVLSGHGRAFMAGGDLAGFAADFDEAPQVVNQLLDALHAVILALRSHPAPVLASVHGVVAGAGLSLMAGCDLVIAAKGTRFKLAYGQIGASPDCGASYFLPRLVGERRAAELMFLAAEWDTAQALSAGLINVEADNLQQQTRQLATTIAAGATQAFAGYKQLLLSTSKNTLEQQLEAERNGFIQATHTKDFREGVSAFLERRQPAFDGK